MAKRVVYERYTFTPSTRTIVVTGKWIRREQLLLITNVTRGTVIYNFSDPSLGYTSFIPTMSGGTESTTIVVSFDTTGHSSTDYLSILVEETNATMEPSETLLDPVGKMRVSTPQSLIDTDFEYGTQPTKWETLATVAGRPGPYYDPSIPITKLAGYNGTTLAITSFSVSGTIVTVNTSQIGASTTANVGAGTNVLSVTAVAANSQPIRVGMFVTGTGLNAGERIVGMGTGTGGVGDYQLLNTYASAVTSTTVTMSIVTYNTPIFVTGTGDVNADGWWLINAGVAGTSFSFYTSQAPIITTGLYDAQKTYIYPGRWYSGSSIPLNAVSGAISCTGTVATFTVNNNHGLVPGNQIFVCNTSVPGLNGVWELKTVNRNTLTVSYTGVAATPTYVQASTLYVRPAGFTVHRPFDGGVQFTNQTPWPGASVVRQTRRQFRYQSGKGLQFSTGTILKPPVQINSLSASGTTITATTRGPHGFSYNSSLPLNVIISGADQSEYNGTFAVTATPNQYQFTYTAASAPAVTPATNITNNALFASPVSWYGSVSRVGLFDSQNGAFFEFDGTTLYAVRRSSTRQLSGTYTTTQGSNTVTCTSGSGSVGTDVVCGDSIVIRGQTYQVYMSASGSITLLQPYRGVSGVRVVVSKVVDTRVAQSAWNIDRMDGTGASGFTLDLSKMQMLYIDYSWYGAGAIRWGFKNNRGEVIYCHRMVNNNVNYEAYMRSGNLVARYETSTVPNGTISIGSIGSSSGGGTLTVRDTSMFPPSGFFMIEDALSTNAEIIQYTSTANNTLTYTNRGQFGTTAGTFFSNSNVKVYYPVCAPILSHWGSSVIMDGRYDDDKSFIFNIGMNTALTNLSSGVRRPIMALRIAPAVDNGQIGRQGEKEIINRMQMVLRSVDVYTGTGATNAGFRIDLILNGYLTNSQATAWSSVGGSSLAQYMLLAGTDTITGGESIASFFAAATGITQQDLALTRDLGSNILGDYYTNTLAPQYYATQQEYGLLIGASGLYPDGPDVLFVCATALGATSSINARISWTEAQA